MNIGSDDYEKNKENINSINIAQIIKSKSELKIKTQKHIPDSLFKKLFNSTSSK